MQQDKAQVQPRQKARHLLAKGIGVFVAQAVDDDHAPERVSFHMIAQPFGDLGGAFLQPEGEDAVETGKKGRLCRDGFRDQLLPVGQRDFHWPVGRGFQRHQRRTRHLAQIERQGAAFGTVGQEAPEVRAIAKKRLHPGRRKAHTIQQPRKAGRAYILQHQAAMQDDNPFCGVRCVGFVLAPFCGDLRCGRFRHSTSRCCPIRPVFCRL